MSRPAQAKRPSPAASTAEGAWSAKMERLRRRVRPQNRLRICDDAELRQRYDEAEQTARRARFVAEANPGDELAARQAVDADAAREKALTALDAASEFLTFRALPRPVLEELIAQHPPTEQQAEEGAIFNADTFPAALVAAASVDGMSREEAEELLNGWSAPDANALWDAAWQVQQESRVELGKG
ncbi:hypothetical protein TPA0910_30120 [Streptomyces hygroscopicus subsp. sporocinereus]|uniref:Uncharacterized protein n=1 Tax=Streptomyces hygroscopicus TaxID=1912 RepID=A0ABQ3TYX1_STRHY|nr:hypothetical protein [Streptomyces hygroscopicus]GHJ28579.1 hypothetical protein TPA0910_30120 [Streptomyces hygroscopicus]